MLPELEVPGTNSAERAHAVLTALVDQQIASRIFAHDAGLWGPAAAAEAACRLGWTDFALASERVIAELTAVQNRFATSGISRIVLCGMGGSSLAPEVIARWQGVQLTVLSSTHPEVLRQVINTDLAHTGVVIASKSGGTIETTSHRAAFAAAFAAAGISAAERIVVVTDPGSPLQESAVAAGQTVICADPDVGGRFSALTAFGLVPSGLAGADVHSLISEASAVRDALRADTPENPALRLAAQIASGLPERYVLAVSATDPAAAGLGRWVEQLVAESTGKAGHGILPIELEPDAFECQPGQTPPNTLRVSVGPDPAGTLSVRADAADGGILNVAAPLGAHFLLWEVATAVLGWILGIDPFNQPDVESAKVAARTLLDTPQDAADQSFEQTATEPEAAETIERITAAVPPNGYLAIQAYLQPSPAVRRLLSEFREGLAQRTGAPVALGWGPGYLHSTGQLHKGGPATGAFIQFTQLDVPEYSIPDSNGGFGALITAQARGDHDVLVERGRPVISLATADPEQLLTQLVAGLRRQ